MGGRYRLGWTAVARARGLLGLALLVLALSPLSVPAQAQAPGILLIVIDTLRQDHTGCSGYERATTPALDALSADAVRFSRAYSAAPWTLPSIATILTGLYPSTHGAVQVDSHLLDEALTLAEILQANGYATAGVVSHSLLSRRRGMGQGYERFAEVVRQHQHNYMTTGPVTDRALEFLEALASGEKPYFLFVHYFDPHYNYLRHPEYGFAPDSAGRLRGEEDLEELMGIEGELTPKEFGFLADLYDEEVRFTDDGVARLLARLRELGLYERTLIVVTADHGEEFGEHGGLSHGRTLYDEIMRVPIVLREPGHTGRERVISTPVSLVALAPTILSLVGIDPAPFLFQGRSLAPLLSGRAPADSVVYFEVDFDEVLAYKKGVVAGGYKLVRDETVGWVRLHEIESDPEERNNLASRTPEVVGRLMPLLDGIAARARALPPVAEPAPLDEQRLERLRSLGYVH